jgi:hypothetical protein
MDPTAPSRTPRPIRRLLIRTVACLLLGAVAALGVGIVLAGNLDPRTGQAVTAERVEGFQTWSVSATYRPGGAYIQSVRELANPTVTGYASWSVEQVLGPPNTFGYGDISTAWTTPSQDNTQAHEWLEVDYASAVVPDSVLVHETYNPGAMVRATVYNSDGVEVEAWSGTDPNLGQQTSCVSKVPLAVDFPVNRVRLYLDTAKVSGWNEIDAVALVGKDGSTRWVTAARASASYGTTVPQPTPPNRVTSPTPEQAAPSWSGADRPGEAFARGQVMREERVAAAFGWPFLVVAGTQEAKPPAPSQPTTAQPGGGTGTGPVSISNSVYTTSPGMGPGVGSTVIITGSLAPPMPGGSGIIPPAPAVTLAQGVIPRPSRVLWGGLALDAVVFAPALALLYWLAVVPQRFVREVARMRKGRCIACGYDLGYDFLHGCPECGWRRGAESPGPMAGRSLEPHAAAGADGSNGSHR